MTYDEDDTPAFVGLILIMFLIFFLWQGVSLAVS